MARLVDPKDKEQVIRAIIETHIELTRRFLEEYDRAPTLEEGAALAATSLDCVEFHKERIERSSEN